MNENNPRRPEAELEELLALLSHELRDPIHAISTNAWLIRSRASAEGVRRPAEAIERQVATLSQRLDDLLDVVRISQQPELKQEELTLQRVVSAAVEATEAREDVHRRELTVEMAEDPIEVTGDRARLEQCVANLLSNAIKYSPQQSRILVTVAREDGEAVVRVSQHPDLKLEEVALQRVVSAAVEAVERREDVQRRELSVEMPEEPIQVRADRALLEQCVANLLSNAIRYSPQQARIVVTVGREGDEAQVRVKDEGVGLDAQELPRLFDRFTRGVAARQHGVGGLGIGLFVTRKLMEAHGGGVEARSEGRDRGAEFVLRLPAITGNTGLGSQAAEEA